MHKGPFGGLSYTDCIHDIAVEASINFLQTHATYDNCIRHLRSLFLPTWCTTSPWDHSNSVTIKSHFKCVREKNFGLSPNLSLNRFDECKLKFIPSSVVKALRILLKKTLRSTLVKLLVFKFSLKQILLLLYVSPPTKYLCDPSNYMNPPVLTNLHSYFEMVHKWFWPIYHGYRYPIFYFNEVILCLRCEIFLPLFLSGFQCMTA